MPKISLEEANNIMAVLKKRGVILPCPRCGNTNVQLIDGYFNQPVSSAIGKIELGGPIVPSIITACVNCGFLSQHALGIIGLLPAKKEETK